MYACIESTKVLFKKKNVINVGIKAFWFSTWLSECMFKSIYGQIYYQADTHA